METFEVQVVADVYVEVEFGGEQSARDLARDIVANGWLLRYASAFHKAAGKYVVKGLSAVVGESSHFVGNGRVTGAKEVRDAEDS